MTRYNGNSGGPTTESEVALNFIRKLNGHPYVNRLLHCGCAKPPYSPLDVPPRNRRGLVRLRSLSSCLRKMSQAAAHEGGSEV